MAILKLNRASPTKASQIPFSDSVSGQDRRASLNEIAAIVFDLINGSIPMITQPFSPAYTQGQIVSPTAAAASIGINPEAKNVCLTNLGAAVCYVRIGVAPIAATTADYPVPPGLQMVVTKGDGQNTLSYISAGGTTLHVMVGEGF